MVCYCWGYRCYIIYKQGYNTIVLFVTHIFPFFSLAIAMRQHLLRFFTWINEENTLKYGNVISGNIKLNGTDIGEWLLIFSRFHHHHHHLWEIESSINTYSKMLFAFNCFTFYDVQCTQCMKPTKIVIRVCFSINTTLWFYFSLYKQKMRKFDTGRDWWWWWCHQTNCFFLLSLYCFYIMPITWICNSTAHTHWSVRTIYPWMA